MDIAGAKALKRRLGAKGAHTARRASAEVSDDAPPVYHYLGVSDAKRETPAPAADSARGSLFRRLRLNSR